MHGYGLIAQLAEQGPFKPEVLGSSPSRPTISTERDKSLKKPEVTMKVQEFLNLGGRIFRRRQGRRTITVAYSRSEDGFIHYGATIHQQNSPREQFNRKAHNQTAVDRFEHAAVSVPDIPDVERVEQRDDYVRQQLLTHGCFLNTDPWINPTAMSNDSTEEYASLEEAATFLEGEIL